MMRNGPDGFDLRGVGTKSELIDCGTAFAKAIGCKNFSYILLRPPENGVLKDDPVLTDCPPGWISRYTERNYQFNDPLVRICSQSRLPFLWGYQGFDKRLKKAERIVMHEAREFDLVEGYTVPTAGPQGDAGGLCLCVDAPGRVVELVAESAARIQLFAAEFHAAAIRILFEIEEKPVPDLTPREREVLSWAADGLSSEATAARMGLASPTVNYHIANCCRKLGASNKIQAVALAVRQGLI